MESQKEQDQPPARSSDNTLKIKYANSIPPNDSKSRSKELKRSPHKRKRSHSKSKRHQKPKYTMKKAPSITPKEPTNPIPLEKEVQSKAKPKSSTLSFKTAAKTTEDEPQNGQKMAKNADVNPSARNFGKRVKTVYLSRVPASFLNFSKIEKEFEPFGTIQDIHISREHLQCFVQFLSYEEAQKAVEKAKPVFGNDQIEIRGAFYDKESYISIEIAQNHFALLSQCKKNLGSLFTRFDFLQKLRPTPAKEQTIAAKEIFSKMEPFLVKIGKALRSFCEDFPAQPNESKRYLVQSAKLLKQFDFSLEKAFGDSKELKNLNLREKLGFGAVGSGESEINFGELFGFFGGEAENRGTGADEEFLRKELEKKKIEKDTRIYYQSLRGRNSLIRGPTSSSRRLFGEKQSATSRVLKIGGLPQHFLCNRFIRTHFYKYGYIERSVFKGDEIYLLFQSAEMAQNALAEKAVLSQSISLCVLSEDFPSLGNKEAAITGTKGESLETNSDKKEID